MLRSRTALVFSIACLAGALSTSQSWRVRQACADEVPKAVESTREDSCKILIETLKSGYPYAAQRAEWEQNAQLAESMAAPALEALNAAVARITPKTRRLISDFEKTKSDQLRKEMLDSFLEDVGPIFGDQWLAELPYCPDSDFLLLGSNLCIDSPAPHNLYGWLKRTQYEAYEAPELGYGISLNRDDPNPGEVTIKIYVRSEKQTLDEITSVKDAHKLGYEKDKVLPPLPISRSSFTLSRLASGKHIHLDDTTLGTPETPDGASPNGVHREWIPPTVNEYVQENLPRDPKNPDDQVCQASPEAQKIKRNSIADVDLDHRKPEDAQMDSRIEVVNALNAAVLH